MGQGGEETGIIELSGITRITAMLPNPLWPVAVFLSGAIAGSFLNTLVARLPDMLLRPAPDLSLSTPRSFCPTCKQTLRIRDLVPLFSYLVLRGHCAHCGVRIPWRYFVLEVTAGFIALGAWWHFNDPLEATAVSVLGWGLLALSVIDWRTRLLPDLIVYPLLWLGLLLNLNDTFAPLPDAVIGAAAGYLSLWFLHHLFRLLVREEGMGGGDFKLFAVCGAWLGWMFLPWIALLASVLCLLSWLALLLRGQHARQLAFGPALSAALAWMLIVPESVHVLAHWLSLP